MELTDSDSSRRLMFIFVGSLLVFTGIVGAAYLLWCLIAPYATGVMSAVLLSVVFRHRIEANRVHDREVASFVSSCRQRWSRGSVWFTWLSVLIAASWNSFFSADQAASFNGLSKYPALRRSPSLRVVCFCAFIVFLCRSLGGFEALMIFCVGHIILTIAATCIAQDVSVPALLRRYNLLFSILLFLLFVRNAIEEAGQLRNDAVDGVWYVQNLGVVIPKDALTDAPLMLSNYVFSENATVLLLHIASSLTSHDGLLHGNVSATETLTRLWEAALKRDFTQIRQLVPSNYSSALSEIGLHVYAHVKGICIAVITALSSVLLFALSTAYEIGIFYFVLRLLASQRHTVVFHILQRILSWTSENQDESTMRAKACEDSLTEKFDLLFQAYWHLTVFHFAATFSVFTAFGIPYRIAAGLFSIFFAVIPIGVPVSLPCWAAIATLAIQDSFVSALLMTAATISIEMVGRLIPFFMVASGGGASPKHRTRPFVDPSVVATSVILGFVSFGFKGVVIGPVILITVQGLWTVCGAEAEPTTKEKTQ